MGPVYLALLQASKRWRLILLIYLFQIVLALSLGLQIYGVLEASIGHSMSLRGLVGGFDYTTIQDLFNVHGASISPLVGMLRWCVISYLLVTAFINGGIWNIMWLDDNEETWMRFWQGGAKYFGRFLLIGLIMNLLLLIWTIVVWGWYVSSFFNMMETWFSDARIFWLGCGLLVVWLHGIYFLFLWTSYAKAYIVSTPGISVLKLLKGGFQLTIGRYIVLLPKVWLFVLLLLLVYAILFLIEGKVGITSSGLILVFVVLQQLIVWVKIIHRLGAFQFLWNDFNQIRGR